jgi:hypothetical protein
VKPPPNSQLMSSPSRATMRRPVLPGQRYATRPPKTPQSRRAVGRERGLQWLRPLGYLRDRRAGRRSRLATTR